VQKAIACILGALDDKIELNRRMNETLEAMARAIFKSWFVDFDPVRAKAEGQKPPGLAPHIAELFPDAFEESELDEIPKGWRVGNLGDIIEIHDSKRIPMSSRERQIRQGPYRYYGAAGIIDYVDDFLFDGVYVLIGEDGSVMTEAGNPVTQYVWGKFWVNNHAHVLKGTDGVSDEQLLLFLQQVYVVPFVTGAVQPKLSQTNMKAIPLVQGSSKLNRAFSRIVQPLFAKIRAIQDEVETLAAIRDTLLPKLISGELRVPDAERIVRRRI
jgi:restriction endonuclease S subunit